MRSLFCFFAVVGLLVVAATGQAAVRIVASTTDLASIAKAVGGDRVKVESIVRGKADPHFVELLPSYMVKVAKADIYLKVGMDLDFWANQIIDGSRNGDLVIVDCSESIAAVEVPKTKVDASMGDVHIQGNPHYWLDPSNGVLIAESITNALTRADPENSAAYESGLEDFRRRLQTKIGEWKARGDAIRGKEIVTYHNSWPYFARSFGIRVAGFVEPKPGIEPTATHTAQLISMIEERNIKVIGKEPYFSDRAPKSIAQRTNARVVDLPTSVGGVESATDYFSLFDTLLSTLVEGLAE